MMLSESLQPRMVAPPSLNVNSATPTPTPTPWAAATVSPAPPANAMTSLLLPSPTPTPTPTPTPSTSTSTTVTTFQGNGYHAHHAPYHGTYLLPTIIAVTVVAVSLTFAATVAFRCGALVLTPRQQTAVRVAIQAALVLSCAAVGAARYVDLHDAGHKQPVIPAAATTASWAAAITLVPVPKALNIFRLFGNGYERLVPYHATLGLITLAAGTLHGAWVVIKQLPKWTDVFAHVAWNAPPGANLFVQMHQTNLAGFLAWSFFVLIAVSSHRRLRSCAFGLWRAAHLSFATLAYFFVMVHDPKTVTLLLPGIVFYGAERLMRAAMTVAANARIEEAIAHEEAGVVEVHVRLHGLFSAMLHAPTDEGLARMNVLHKLCCRFLRLVGRALVPRLSAGDFVHIGVLCPTSPSLWRLSPAHPFTVARYDHADRTATFFVKAVGPWTRALLAAAAQSDARPLLNARVSWCGPCGSLQVPLDSVPNHLLVCGGVGVTPMISILQALAAGVRCGVKCGCCAPAITASHHHCRVPIDLEDANSSRRRDSDSGDSDGFGECYGTSRSPLLSGAAAPSRSNDRDVGDQRDGQCQCHADADAEMGDAVLVWCVRGLALATSLWPTVAPLAAAASVRVRIFDTSATTDHPAMVASEPSGALHASLMMNGDGTLAVTDCGDLDHTATLSAPQQHAHHSHCNQQDSTDSFRPASVSQEGLLSVVEPGRPNIAAILAQHFDKNNIVERSGDHASSSLPKVGVFCCGPPGLASQCFAAATARGNTFVHNEEF